MRAIADKTEQAQVLIHDLLSRGEPSCVTSSFQTECIVLVHMIIQRKPDIPILFLDTGYQFPETYAYRDEMAERFGLNLVNLRPKITVARTGVQVRPLISIGAGSVLRIPQGGAAVCGPRSIQHLVHGS